MERRVVDGRHLDRLEVEPEHRPVERPGGLGIGRPQILPGDSAGRIHQLGAGVVTRFPHGEGRSRRVRGDDEAAQGSRRVEGHDDRAACLGDPRRRRLGVVGGEVEQPADGLVVGLGGADAGDPQPVHPRASIATARILRERPPQDRGVERAGCGHIGDGKIGPAGHAGGPRGAADRHGDISPPRSDSRPAASSDGASTKCQKPGNTARSRPINSSWPLSSAGVWSTSRRP